MRSETTALPLPVTNPVTPVEDLTGVDLIALVVRVLVVGVAVVAVAGPTGA
jgi:hypothetical protein